MLRGQRSEGSGQRTEHQKDSLLANKRHRRHEYTVVYQTIEDGWIMASVPELPGAVTQGKDLVEARAMIKDAVELLLQGNIR